MALVTGSLKDIKLQSTADVALRLRFTLDSSAFIGSMLIAPVSRYATLNIADDFFIDLAPTDQMSGDHWYTLAPEWLDPVAGWSPADFMEWKIRVPSAGGPLSALMDSPISAYEVWIVPGGTIPPVANPGDLMFDPLTNDLFTLS